MPDSTRWRWPNFEPSEFVCTHCGEQRMRETTLDRLQRLRDAVNRPLIITSAYRCPQHPIEVAKASGPGAHAFGAAIDIRATGQEAAQILAAAVPMGWTGFGVSQHRRGPRFVHLDDVQPGEFGLVRPTVWSY